MKPGDLVTYRGFPNSDVGLFIGMRKSKDYEYAEVLWFHKSAPNGDRVSTIQHNLLEVINENR